MLRRASALGLGIALALGAAPAAAEDAPLDGRAIMQRVDARARGADETLRARWRLVDKSGSERIHETRTYWRDERARGGGLHSRRLIVFDAPPTVKGTAFLVWSHLASGEEDDRWVYLPALRKVRRIAGGDRAHLFAGSDFTYEDLSERAVDEDEHRLLRSEDLAGVRHYVVESTPKADSAYAKRLLWVDAQTFLVSRIEFHDRAARPEKSLALRWREADGLWFWERLEMDHARRNHRTVIEVLEIAHDSGLGEDVFRESALQRGAP